MGGGGTGLGNIPEKINVPLSDSQSQFFLLTIQSLRRAVNSELNEIMLSSNHFRFIRSSILIVFLSSAGGQTLDPLTPPPTTAAVVCLLQYCNQLDLDQQNQHQDGVTFLSAILPRNVIGCQLQT